MGTFLEVLGLIFLAAILLVATALLFVFLKLRRAMRSFKDTMGQFTAAMASQPATISLEGPASVPWSRPDQVHALADPLPALGYHDAGQFAVNEVNGLNLWAFVNPSESAYAVVYEHPAGLVWMDFVTRYTDGTKLTVTNNDQGAPLDKPPGNTSIYAPGATTDDLHRRHLAERPDKPREPASAADFRETFERAYVDEMAWRNARGGPTEREIRALAQRAGITISEEEIEATSDVRAWQAAAGLDEALRKQFTESADLPPRDWERLRDRLLLVHDRLTTDMLADRVGDCLAADPEDDSSIDEDDFPPDLPAREAFLRYNARLPRDRRFVKIGEVDHPLPADVYRPASA